MEHLESTGEKRSLDASREQEQIEEGMWLYRMDDLRTGKGSWQTHTTPTSDGKNAELLGYIKHYLGKPLAGKEGRPLKIVG